MAYNPPISTLGYPSQQAAIVALYLDGIAPSIIARRCGASINAVTRSIHRYQKKTGSIVPVKAPVKRGRPFSERTRALPKDWRLRNYVKSIRGARAALEAAGL